MGTQKSDQFQTGEKLGQRQHLRLGYSRSRFSSGQNLGDKAFQTEGAQANRQWHENRVYSKISM